MAKHKADVDTVSFSLQNLIWVKILEILEDKGQRIYLIHKQVVHYWSTSESLLFYLSALYIQIDS